MRVECESCRQLVVARLAIEGDAIRATCPACRHVTRAIAESPAADAAATTGDPDAASCPKCGAARRPGAPACPACGLAVDRMAVYRDARDAAVAEPVRAAWTAATAAWTDDARHDTLFQRAAAHNAYAWTAGRYRTRGSDPIAARQLERLRRAAEATLLAGATARADAGAKPYRTTAAVLVMLVIAIGAGLLYAVVIRARRGPARNHAPTPGFVDPAGPPTGQPAGGDPAASEAPGTRGPAGVRPLVPGHPVSSSTIK